MSSYFKYKWNQSISWLDKNKDRISLLNGIIGFISTIYALYDTKNFSNENYRLSRAVFQLQQREHILDSINDTKKETIDNQRHEFQISQQQKSFKYQDSINKQNLQAVAIQNKVAEQQLRFQIGLYKNQLRLEEPVFSLAIDKIENKQISFRLYNDGKRDALIKKYQFYTITFEKDTTLMVDLNSGTSLIHPGNYILFWVLKSQLDFLSRKKHSYIVYRLSYIDQFLNERKNTEIIYGMHILPIQNSYSAELLSISDSQIERIKNYMKHVPPIPDEH